MEVKIGVQHAARELVIDSDEKAEDIEKRVSDAIGGDGVLVLTDLKGRKTIIPAAKVAYVEIGGGVAGTVGFRG